MYTLLRHPYAPDWYKGLRGPPGPPGPAGQRIVDGVIIADAPPAGSFPGLLWWDSIGGRLYIWYTSARSGQWVQIIG